MEIYVGGTEITDIKIGNTEINSVWIGANQVWSRGYTLTLDYDTQYQAFSYNTYTNTNYAGYSGTSGQPINGSIDPNTFTKSPLVTSSQSTPSITHLFTYEKAGTATTDQFTLHFQLDKECSNSGWTSMTIQRLYNGAPTGSVFTYARTTAGFLSSTTSSIWIWDLYYTNAIGQTVSYDPFNNSAGTEYEIKFT